MPEQVLNDYFIWICSFVSDDYTYDGESYFKLLSQLYSEDFEPTIERDDNRCKDGIDLRYYFGDEEGLDTIDVADILDNRACSMLEMMIALAKRCEEQIMDDPEAGNRTDLWFWKMINSLGLAGMDDDNYDEDYVLDILNRFMHRDYKKNGQGGLFTLKHKKNVNEAELWYQMMWYLDEFLEERR